MAYANHSYTPQSFNEILEIVIEKWNSEFGSDYDVETFKGSNAYRYIYVAIQTIIEQQSTTAEIYAKLQDYFDYINAIIKIPATTNSGLVQVLKDAGFPASVRPNTQAQAGKIAIAVDVDNEAPDYAVKKAQILQIIKDSAVAGMFFDGDQEAYLTLSNGQVFPFAFSLANKIPTNLRITITYARGSNFARDADEAVKEKLLLNLKNLYGLGADFAPEKYFEIFRDAPYAANVVLEYQNTKTSAVWASTIYTADYTDLFTFEAQNITVIFNGGGY